MMNMELVVLVGGSFAAMGLGMYVFLYTPEIVRMFLRRERRKEGLPEVLLLGDSLTLGTVSFPWAKQLRERFSQLHLINEGKNCDTSHALLARLPASLDKAGPQTRLALVLVGTNDAFAICYKDNMAKLVYGSTHLPNGPASVESYTGALREIIRQVKSTPIGGRVVVVSPPPMGDDASRSPAAPGSTSFFHRRVTNDVTHEVAASAEAVARDEGCGYIPLYERMAGLLVSDSKKASAEEVNAFTAAKLNYFARRPYTYTTDGIHLNEAGGQVLVELLTPVFDELVTKLPSARSKPAEATTPGSWRKMVDLLMSKLSLKRRPKQSDLI